MCEMRGGVNCVIMRRAESICLTLSGGFSPQAPLQLHEGPLSSAPLPVLRAQMWEQTAGRQGCCGPRTSLSTLPWPHTHTHRPKRFPLSSYSASCAPELNKARWWMRVDILLFTISGYFFKIIFVGFCVVWTCLWRLRNWQPGVVTPYWLLYAALGVEIQCCFIQVQEVRTGRRVRLQDIKRRICEEYGVYVGSTKGAQINKINHS